MPQFSGQATVHVNGALVDTFDGVKLDTGGWERTPVTTSSRSGFKKSKKPAQLDIPYSIAKGDSIKDLDVEGATIQVAFDTGQTYVVRDAFRGPTAKVNDEGKTETTFYGQAADEVS